MRRIIIQSFLTTAFALPELALQKKSYADLGLPLLRRDTGTLQTNPFSVLSWSSGGAYYCNVTIGSPPQNQVVILDTGSSDLYFDASDASSCENTASAYSCRGGTFNHANSNTYKEVDAAPAFNTSFGDGSTAVGPFAEDVFGIGDVFIPKVQFGVAEQVKSTTGYAIGLMGVGYSLNEATVDQYPNVPEVLKDAGVISSRLYSVYLNDVGTGSGSILFGGVDTSKYTSPLVTFNLLPDPYTLSTTTPTVDQFITTVTALDVKVNGKTNNIFKGGQDGVSAYRTGNTAIAALLDTGSSAWTVPSDYYDEIASRFSYVDKQGLCACSHRDSGDTLTLTFAGKLQITVPSEEFIVPIYNATTREPYIYDTAGNAACAFMISADTTRSSYLTLGDAILRSMYVVFDLDNGQVSLAQANVNSTAASNIVKIPSGTNGVASAVSASSAAKQTYAIASQVSASHGFTASTAATTIGTATGVDAVPTEARVTDAGAPAAASSSKAAASSVYVPGFNVLSTLTVMWAALMAVSGAFLLL